MCRMNIAGAAFANIDGVKAMTDVTGFLACWALRCAGARSVQALLCYQDIPKLRGVEEYIALGAVPGGTERNFASYGHFDGRHVRVKFVILLCDPQASEAVCCWR